MTFQNPRTAILKMQLGRRTRETKLSEILAPSRKMKIRVPSAKDTFNFERKNYEAIMAEVLPMIANSIIR
jgi:hypothetical protein